MRELKPNPCLKCEERYIGCHGKNEDGTCQAPAQFRR